MTEKIRDMKRKGFDRRGAVTVAILLLSVFVLRYVAKAEVYLLENSGDSLFVGDVLTIPDYFDKDALEDIQSDSIQYSISEESQNKSCITVTADGKVTAASAGKAVVDITYIETETQTARTESFIVTVLPPEQVAAEYGSIIWLSAFNMYNPYLNYDYGNNGENGGIQYSYSFSGDSAVLDEDGEGVRIRGFQNVKVYMEKMDLRILVAEITVNLPEFKKQRMARAVGTKAFYPELQNYMQEEAFEYIEEGISNLPAPVWGVEDEKVVTLSEGGFCAVATGSTKLTAKFTAENGDELLLELTITVTNPKLTKDYVVVAVGGAKKLPVTGVCSDSTFVAGIQGNTTEDSEYDFLEDAYSEDSETWFRYAYINASRQICGSAEGMEEAVVIVDGKVFSIKIVVTNPHYENNTFTMYKSLKKSLLIAGLNKKYSSISYTSANEKIATVTAAGKVTAKTVGTVKIKVKADGKTFPVWVEVSTKKGYDAAKKEIAISKTKTKYSQAKRMSKGYYDCSSLVSRVYRKFGVYFGSKSGWSPTAAGIGQWCAEHKKVIAKKGVSYTKLVPGDLVFYSYAKNGRYLNISHIEMYVGNGMSVSASSSNNKVIHYGYSPNSVVLIARPTK